MTDTLTVAPQLEVAVLSVDGRKVWPMFAPHHYLTSAYSGHGAFMAVLPDGTPVAFTSYIAFPHGRIKNAKRGHRTVVLPDYQGFGIGARLSDWMGEYLLAQGYRFYSRTSHPRLGEYRDASPYWRATAKKQAISQDTVDRLRASGKSRISANVKSVGRICYSHEYIGGRPELDPADVPYIPVFDDPDNLDTLF